MSKHPVAKKAKSGSPASKRSIVTEGSYNPFADLGFANPELELAKSRLVMEMARVIEARDLSQARAGEIIGLPQPKLSQLLNGHWKSYSVDRLTRYLNKLGVTVRITLETNRKTWNEGHLVVAENR
jgi:predicted XRE-type DNA-binding protein